MTIRDVEVVRVDLMGTRAPGQDAAAVEEPLQVRVNGEPFAVIMRTPGADRELAAGFVFAEGLVHSPSELQRVDVAGVGADPAPHNVVDVTITALDQVRREVARRRVATTSSCGLCGRQTIESLTIRAPRVNGLWTIDPACLTGLPGQMRGAQRAFDATGGLHAAALFDCDGRLDAVAEDVGRHNAVDKIVGRKLLAGELPLDRSMLCVSGRASFEIIQKALMARVPVVVAVSAPSTLAVELAVESGITLVGFVRDGRFNIYAHPRRVSEPSTPHPEPLS